MLRSRARSPDMRRRAIRAGWWDTQFHSRHVIVCASSARRGNPAIQTKPFRKLCYYPIFDDPRG